MHLGFFKVSCLSALYHGDLRVAGIWRIIRGWLDPVVAAKVHFTNHRAGLEEFISPNRIIRDLDGDEDWKYEYEGPIDGENDAMADTTTKDRLLKEREELYVQFEANTRRWIDHPSSEVIQRIKAERSEIAARLKDSYWRLDPYLRARSLYDRQGIIRAGGDVNWYRQELS